MAYIRKEIINLSPDIVLKEVVFQTPARRNQKEQMKIIEGDWINMSSWRYQTFAKSGTVCVCCGLKASFFAKERFEKSKRFHLNLYGLKDGKEIMFTKDHIVPKSLGGKDLLSNFQTMCMPCNTLKGNTIS